MSEFFRQKEISMDLVSIVLPSKNEAASLVTLLPAIQKVCGAAEIIVVNDGSTDNTDELCQACGVRQIRHPYSKGNGAAIKAGARAAKGEIIVFMDADGQHKPTDILRLLDKIHQGYDLVVGARDTKSQAGLGRLAANTLYNKLASWMVEHPVEDLTSGFRAVVAKRFHEFLYLLPNGFSYPTTSTMAFFRAGFSIAYIPIQAEKRIGKSHINLRKDGIRFLLIIFKVGTLYSPLKLFTPISASFFTMGLIYYVYTYFAMGRFTNMSGLLFSTAVIIFLMGLVSEQITSLQYKETDQTHERSDGLE